MASEDFGTDISTFQGLEGAVDVDPLMPAISGVRIPLEGIVRRFNTPKGALSYAGLPNYGYDLLSLAGKRMSTFAIARAEAALAQEAAQEQGVLGATVQLKETSPGVYRVNVSVRLASGPFTLVIQASALTLQLLKVIRG